MAPLNRGFEYKRIAGAEAEGYRIIDYLSVHFPAFTSDVWLTRISEGRVLLDGIPVEEDQGILPGQLLTWIRPPWVEPDVPCSFAVLHRDESLLAVAKPAGLPTLPGGGVYMDNTLLSLVRRHFPEANPLHRLGRGTSGIVLFALTGNAAKKMVQAWSGCKVLKVYRALISGCPEVDDFDVDVPIGPVPHRTLKTIYAASSEGKPAHSRITVLERREDSCLAGIRITTGRPHQIRIHLAALGHPLVGDPLYMSGGVPAPDSRALPSDLGYHLHNALLGFQHPETGKWMEISCMPPPRLRLRCNGEK
jgi:23S rRNA pseudouridine1911/1915/1917 synthase